jgi:hypothetical protein
MMEKFIAIGVSTTDKISNAGRPYTKYDIIYNDNLKAGTIKKEFGDYIKNNIGKELQVELEKNNFGEMEIKVIEGVQVEQRGGGGGGRKWSAEDIARMDKREAEKKASIEMQTALKSADADMNILTTITEIKTEQEFNELKGRRVSWNIKRLQEDK